MRILISGAGIAGPALALWLHRAGADVTVVERAPAPRPGGHAVDVRGVARQVIEKMGVREAVRARQIDDRGFAMVDEHDRRLVAMPADMFGGEGIVAEIEIARGDLARILYDATAPHVHYRFGDRITELTPDGHVTFASGGRDRFDVVAGADGVRSAATARTSPFPTPATSTTGRRCSTRPGAGRSCSGPRRAAPRRRASASARRRCTTGSPGTSRSGC
jgi:2-polyprenyl-6-methoxyphenol hydroxylase-like FAD-dependent oxidoreductase